MAKIQITESELKQLIRESVEETLNEEGILGKAYNFGKNQVKNVWNNTKNSFNGAKNLVKDTYNDTKQGVKNTWNRVNGTESANLKNQLSQSNTNARNLQQSVASKDQQITNLKASNEKYIGELQQIAAALGVAYGVSPQPKPAQPMEEAAQPQVTGVQAILGAIKKLQGQRNQLAKDKKNLAAQLAQANQQNASLQQRIQNGTLPTPSKAAQLPTNNALAQNQGGLAPRSSDARA